MEGKGQTHKSKHVLLVSIKVRRTQRISPNSGGGGVGVSPPEKTSCRVVGFVRHSCAGCGKSGAHGSSGCRKRAPQPGRSQGQRPPTPIPSGRRTTPAKNKKQEASDSVFLLVTPKKEGVLGTHLLLCSAFRLRSCYLLFYMEAFGSGKPMASWALAPTCPCS